MATKKTTGKLGLPVPKKTAGKAVVKKTEPKKIEPKKEKNTPAPAMNEPEVEAAKKADEKALSSGASSERLNLLLGLVSQKFGLDDTYAVCQFNDKGKVMTITLENADFNVAVTVKDSERYGLYVE